MKNRSETLRVERILQRKFPAGKSFRFESHFLYQAPFHGAAIGIFSLFKGGDWCYIISHSIQPAIEVAFNAKYPF